MSTPTTAPPPPASPASPGTQGRGTEVRTTATTVMGDGTSAGGRARSRWRRAALPLTVIGLLLLSGLLAAVLRPPTSEVPLAPDNPGPDGGRALAEILQERGVDVTFVRSSAEATDAAGAGTTLLVTSTYLLLPEQAEALAATEADVVLAAPDWMTLDEITDGAIDTDWADGTGGVREASCDDPDAQAAGTLESFGTGLRARGADVAICFPPAGGAQDSGSYAAWSAGERTVVALDDASLLTNDRLADHGHAALALRALGGNETLVWYVPSMQDMGAGAAGPATGSLLPDWASAVALQLLVVGIALALWRGRALGRVVTEPLPVTVRAAEATVGRGRLYRRARSRGHAAAALRAGVARRAAGRLGLPRSAGATEVIEALARATGRPTPQVADLLYGPPPTGDAGLVDLTRRLDQLESEVHRT